MSYLLPHLHSGFAVDQAILGEEDRVVIIRWGHDYDPICMQQDEVGCMHGVIQVQTTPRLVHVCYAAVCWAYGLC